VTTGYTTVFSHVAEEQFERLIHADRRLGERLARAIERLAREPRVGALLTGGWKGYCKYRVGDYRIIYRVEHRQLVIYIIAIAHRREVYR